MDKMNTEVLAEVEKRGHEQVVFFNYPEDGLKAVVGIHNTVLGPGLGGCRMRLYEDEGQAVDDVLRLSEGMTYKSALAGLNLGGGKACILADPNMQKGRRELFLKFAECLNALNGRYITAEDMGTSVEDMMVVREKSEFAAGFSQDEGGGGDPSPWTARGVFNSIVAVCELRYGSSDLKGKHVAVQGAGHVGLHLIRKLTKAGALVTTCDTQQKTLEEASSTYGAKVVDIEAIYDVDCDVFAPCAVGQTVNENTIPRLKCDIIAGAANNVLSDPDVCPLLERKNILYCPDFVVNAGGIICVASEYFKNGWSESWVSNKVRQIADTTLRVLKEAEKRRKFTDVVAYELARERVDEAARARVQAN